MDVSIDAQQLRAIFDTAIDCLIIIDSRGMISKINPAGAKLFGYEQEELMGQNVSMLMPIPHRELHDSYLENYKETNEKKILGIGRDVTGRKKDGSFFPCNLSVNEFYMRSEKCYAGIIHDLTLRKETEQKIIDLNKQLEKTVKIKTDDLSSVVNELLESNRLLEKEILERKKIEKALRDSEFEIRNALEKEKELSDLKSRFVSMASHEFRTPLSTILSSTALIEKYLETGDMDKTEKHFSRVKSSVKNLTEILDDFLSLTKLEEGKIQNLPEHFNLSEFCIEFFDEIQGLLRTGQTIEHELEMNTPVYLDKKLLRNLLLNIFSNAIKYSREGKKIFCGAQVIDNQLMMKVRDEGIGIPLSEQKHLFSRFFRGSNAINIKGTGLGLNIVKQYVNMMDGSIQFESIENKGTTFTIKIPL